MDLETRKLLREVMANGGLPYEVIEASVIKMDLNKVARLKGVLKSILHTTLQWPPSKKAIKELDTSHIYNILQAIQRGQWRTRNGDPNKFGPKVRRGLEMEMCRRGYTPYEPIEEFDTANESWMSEHGPSA